MILFHPDHEAVPSEIDLLLAWVQTFESTYSTELSWLILQKIETESNKLTVLSGKITVRDGVRIYSKCSAPCKNEFSGSSEANETSVVWHRLISWVVMKSLFVQMITVQTLYVFKTLYFIWCFKIKTWINLTDTVQSFFSFSLSHLKYYPLPWNSAEYSNARQCVGHHSLALGFWQ